MKSAFILPVFALLFTGCPLIERTIESTLYYTTEKNNSSYDLFIQYYLENGKITRKKILRNTENRMHFYYKDNDFYTSTMIENNYVNEPDSDPQLTYYESDLNPNERIIKILFVDIETNKIIKRLENIDSIYILDNAEDNYDMRARFEYWLLEITDEWLTGDES
jgi:hypothetical protein